MTTGKEALAKFASIEKKQGVSEFQKQAEYELEKNAGMKAASEFIAETCENLSAIAGELSKVAACLQETQEEEALQLEELIGQ